MRIPKRPLTSKFLRKHLEPVQGTTSKISPIESKTASTPNAEDLIATERVIEITKRLGVSFGRGDPIERIRYFVKLGILPHAIRKASNLSTVNSQSSNVTSGHFPYWVVKRLIVVDRLNRSGMPFPEIAAKLKNTFSNNPNSSNQLPDTSYQKPSPGLLTVSASLWKKAGISEAELDKKLEDFQAEIDQKLQKHKQELQKTINLPPDQNSVKDNLKKLTESDLNSLTGYQSYLKAKPESGIPPTSLTSLTPPTLPPANFDQQPDTTHRSFKKLLITSSFAALLIFTIVLSILQSPSVRQAINKADSEKAHKIAAENLENAQSLGAVLAASSEANKLYIDAVSEFLGETTFIDPITAPNVIYSVTAGTGIAVTAGQNPVVSLDTTEIVTTLNSTSGALTIAGSGGTSVSTSGSTITISSTSASSTSGDITAVNAGNGLTGGASSGDASLAIALTTSGTSTTTSSASGLEFSSGLSLVRGCSNSQILAWITATATWDCTTASSGMTSFDVAGDGGTNQTITNSNILTIAGGTNGIDTSGGATDTITFNLDTTEIGTTTFGSGSSVVWTFDAGTTDPAIDFNSGSVIFNESGADIDLRIEADNNANIFTLDAGLFSGIGQISLGATAQSTATAFVVVDNPAITATSNQNFYKTYIDNSATVTITGATTSSIVASLAIDEPNITATGTVTNASTLYVSGAPTEGSSGNFALWVDDGQSRFENTPVAGSTTGNAVTAVPTYVVEVTDITLSGLRLALDSNGNADSGDVFYGFNADDFTTTSGPTEYGLRIGSGYDYQFYFELGTRDLRISATAPSGGTSPLTATIPALAADDTFCLATLANCFGAGGGAGVTYTSQTTNAVTKFTATAGQITSSGITDDGTTVTIAANESLTFTAGTGSVTQNYSPVGTTGTARALTITPTFGIDTTDQTLSGVYVNPNTNSNSDGGDILNGILIDTITASSATEYALQIGSGWDANVYLNDTTSIIRLADGGNIVIQDNDSTPNTLCTITDSGTTGALSCTGNITGGSGSTVGFWTRTSTTLSPATANDVVSISSNDTSNAVLALTSTGAASAPFTVTANSVTTGTVLGLTGTGLTTGNLLDLTTTNVDATGGTDSIIDINITNNPATNANTLRGLDLAITDADDNANTLYGSYIDVNNSSNSSAGTHSIYGGYFSAAGKTTGTTTAYGVYGTASGADTNYAGYFSLANTGQVYLDLTLSAGARSVDALTITQANDASNDSTANLLQLTNADTASTAALLAISQVAGGTGISITSGFTGIAMSFVAGLTSGSGLDFTSTTSGTLSSYTGDIVELPVSRTHTGATSINDTGNFLDISRTNENTNAGGVFTISGDLVTLSSTCTQTAGTCTDTSDILSLTQSYASASGNVINISNSATTNDVVNITTSSTTTGSAIVATGPTSTGVTDHFVKLTSDVGSAAALIYGAPDFSGSAVTSYGLNITATDSTANANTDYGVYSSLALTGNAAKTGYGYYGTVTSTSTTGDTLYGADLLADHNGALAGATTKTVYGLRAQSTTDGLTEASATVNAYGGYFSTTGGTSGTTTGYGIYATASGYDTNYAGYFSLANTGQVYLDLTLSGGARSVDALTITQANDASNDSTTNLLELNNSDTASSGATLNISDAGTGNLITADSTNSSANGVSIDIASSSTSQYALLVTSNNAATESLRIRADGRTCVGGDCSTISGIFEIDPVNASLTSDTPALNSAIQTFSIGDGGTVAEQKQNQFLAPIINGAAGGSTETVTDAATVYISNQPTGSNITFTNGPYALWVDAGISRFDGTVGVGDTSPDADVDVDSSATSGDVFGILASSLSTGSAILATGPTSTGVTDHFVKLTSDVGSAAALIYGAPDFSGSAVTSYGLNITATDSTANANTDYGIYSNLALTGNAAKTGYADYATVTSSSTTGDTTYGQAAVITLTGAVSGTAQTSYGIYGTATKTGADTSVAATTLYGLYATASNTGSTDAGTKNTYGAYLDATGDTAGTATVLGLYLADVSGGDTNIALCFDCDGTYTSSTVASGIQFGTDANAVTLYRSASDILRTGDGLTVDLDLIVTGNDITFGSGESISLQTDNTIILSSDAASGAGVLRLPVKTDTGDPSLNVEGNIYYNTFDNVFRCYQSAAWTNCIGSGGTPAWSAITNPTTTLALTFDAGETNTFTLSEATGTFWTFTGTAFTTGEVFDITTTHAPADGSTNEAIDINITHTPTVSADNFQSINLTTTDGTALANTVYGISNTLTLTGNAAKTGYGYYGTVTSTSTTGDTLYGADLLADHNGALAGATTKTVYGIRSQATTDGLTEASATVNAYGGYFSTTGGTSGTTTGYGIYSTASGYDTNYAGYFSLANTGQVYLDLTLSGGARSVDALTITQANDASNNSTGNLLQLTNSDAASTAALLNLNQVSGGIGLQIENAVTPSSYGVLLLGGVDGSGAYGIELGNVTNSGIGIEISNLSSGATGFGIFDSDDLGAGNGLLIQAADGSPSAFSGDMILVTSTSALSSGTVTDTGNFLDINRSYSTSGTGNFSMGTGADLVKLTSTCTNSAGTCVDNSSLIDMTQSDADATGPLMNITNSGLTNDVIAITASSLTTGTAILSTGPSSTGVTDHFVKLTSDVGSAAALIYGAPDFSGSAVTGYGLNITATDSTANANTDYGVYSSLALTGNAAKNGYGIYSTVTNTSTTAATEYAGYFSLSDTGIVTSGTDNSYGIYSTATRTGSTTAGTYNTYGGYFTTTADAGGAGTTNAYGIYATATGGDTNYAAYLNGNVLVGKQTDAGGAAANQTLRSQTTEGTIASGGTANINGVVSSAVYNGSLYVGTYESGAAEVYRWDGGTTWTVINTTAGRFGTTTAIDGVTAMTVYNGYLYIATEEANSAEVYRYDGGTGTSVFTPVNTTAGRFQTTTSIDGVNSMIVHDGQLYIGTNEANAAEVYRYEGSTGTSVFTALNTTAGTVCGQASVNSVRSMASYNGNLYAGTEETDLAEVCRYDGGTTLTRVVSAAGTVTSGGRASIDVARSLAVFNGTLYLGTEESGAAEIYRYTGSGTDAAATNLVWIQVNGTDGNICGQTSVDGVDTMIVYNGILYSGTVETGLTEVCRYDGGTTFTRVVNAAGQVASGELTGIDEITTMTPYNNNGSDLLFIGTTDDSGCGSGCAEVYSFTGIEGQSFALLFNAVSDNGGGEQNSFLNLGSISFAAEQPRSGDTGNSATGSFLLSHAITTVAGGYDVAEDYPTKDTSLEAGNIVSVDADGTGFVKKAQGRYNNQILGIYSEKPGLRLSQKDDQIDGAKAVPVALAGRVPVKVSTENGPIYAGDSITSSSTPGVGMKASQPGRVIGIALEPFPASQGEALQGKILVYVNPTFYMGSATALDEWSTLIAKSLVQSEQLNQEAADLHALLAEDIIKAEELLAKLENKHVPTEEEITSLVKDEVNSQLISLGYVNYEAAGATEASGSSVLTAQTNKTLSDLENLLATTDLSLSTLTLTGIAQLAQTQIAGTLSQDGTLIIDYGRQINVLGSTLFLQNDSLAGCLSDPVSCKSGILLDIGKGKFTFDSQGNLITKGEIEAKGLVLSESISASTIGSSQIPAGSNSVIVETSALKPDAKVLITATGPTGGKSIYLSEKTDYTGFTVAIENGPAAQNIEFDWLIINTTQVSSN